MRSVSSSSEWRLGAIDEIWHWYNWGLILRLAEHPQLTPASAGVRGCLAPCRRQMAPCTTVLFVFRIIIQSVSPLGWTELPKAKLDSFHPYNKHFQLSLPCRMWETWRCGQRPEESSLTFRSHWVYVRWKNHHILACTLGTFDLSIETQMAPICSHWCYSEQGLSVCTVTLTAIVW